jgi:hypothetical protein
VGAGCAEGREDLGAARGLAEEGRIAGDPRAGEGDRLVAEALLHGPGEVGVDGEGLVEVDAELGLEGRRRDARDDGAREEGRSDQRDERGQEDGEDDAEIGAAEPAHPGVVSE